MPKRTPPTPTRPLDTYLTTTEAARYIGFSTAYLKKARQYGRGPSYLRKGRSIRYTVSALDRWMQRALVQTSESRELRRAG